MTIENSAVTTAMILAAGFGKRLRPITETVPKPLVPVGGKTMLDRTLDTAAEAGIKHAVVNVHWLGGQIIAHCAARAKPVCIISDERDEILETGGAVVKALPLLGETPFALLNADTFWIDGPQPALPAMMAGFDPERMDILLLCCAVEHTTGHSGTTDFLIDETGRLSWGRGHPDGVIYAGAAIMDPALFAGKEVTPHSLTEYFDSSIKHGRLYGHQLAGGHWLTVGTVEGLALAEAKLADLAMGRPSGQD